MTIDRFEEGFDNDEHWDGHWVHAADEPPHDTESVDEAVAITPARNPTAGEAIGSPQAGGTGSAGLHQQRGKPPFIKGPMCREWFVRAARLRKPAVVAGLALWFKAGVTKDEFLREKRAASAPIRVDRGLKKSFGISASQLSRGLHALADAGLIVIAKGGAGRCPVVVIVNLQTPRDSARHQVI